MATDKGNRLIRDNLGEIPIVAMVGADGNSSFSSTLPAGTDRSGFITAGNAAQQLAPANPTRQALTGQNISAGDLWINEIGGTAAIGAAGSYKIVSGAAFSIATNRAISIIGATTAQSFTATEV